MQEKKQINVEVGSNVKRKREQVGLTQEQLSEKIGIGVKSLSAIERGTVGVSLLTLRNICDALNVSSDALLFGDERSNDVSDLSSRLARMTPAQLETAREMIRVLQSAFGLNSDENEIQ